MPVPQLLAELELLGNALITADVSRVEIIQQTPALAHHHEQSAAGTMVFFVLLQVLRQVIDALREQRDLHISRACVPFVELKIAYRFGLCFHTSNFPITLNLSRFLSVAKMYFSGRRV